MERLEELKQRIDKFNKDRDWDQFHSPVNLVKSISIEAAELLECYQWNDNADIEAVKEELADVIDRINSLTPQQRHGISERAIQTAQKLTDENAAKLYIDDGFP